METSQSYRGYYIIYCSITGITVVHDGFEELAKWRVGEFRGEKLAKNYIDNYYERRF